MPKKNKKSLPMLIIKDEEKDTEKRYINRAFVFVALQGLKLMALQDEDVIPEIDRLMEEVEA
ncbi:MAG: hypothetical protein ACYTEQ_01690 [Planctomycetota bacterium]|jgi:hypothetical protein